MLQDLKKNNRNTVQFLPNAITLLGLISGLTALHNTFQKHYGLTVLFFCMAAVFDFMDGAVARLFNANSDLGAQLDSLADIVSFGVSPALAIYIWGMNTKLGWAVALAYIACAALRLARFNTLLGEPDRSVYAKYFFVGLPTPAGALLLLIPFLTTIQFGEGWWNNQYLIATWTIIVGLLLVSKIPMLSLKEITIPSGFVPIALIVSIGFAVSLFNMPIVTIWVIGLLLLLFIPASAITHYRLTKNTNENQQNKEDMK
ncbi:MAG: CDP-diacylglycerol--serine O-phosphatidyltransferase [Micrococcaceae bacterium]